jgi:membrane protease YdiL (CAAX protease family)
VIALVAAGCLALRAAMVRGWLPDPILRYVSTSSLVCFLVVPMLTLRHLGLRPLAYLGYGDPRPVLGSFAFGLFAVVAGAFVVSRLASFRSAYGLAPSPALCVSLLVGMLCLEFFFRGFLLLPLAGRFGWRAAVLSTVPYALLHAGKPPAEFVGSIPFGLWLSSLAVRSGSIMYGVVLHWILALAIDLLTAAGT